MEERARKGVAVLNPKTLVTAIEGWGSEELTPAQIDLIARQLEERCRDITDC